MIINLKKEIGPGSWRYLGLRCPSILPGEVPIAGASMEAIKDCLKGDCYRIGRINPRNAFILVKGVARFLYVRPTYVKYRYAALKVFTQTQWEVDFDHALAKNICRKATPPFQYVLILRDPPDVNRGHGQLEKLTQLEGMQPDVCFADDRIVDKWLGRPPWARRRSSVVMTGYSYANRTNMGLTLKQRGRWAYAIGIDDNDLSMSGLSLLSSSTA